MIDQHRKAGCPLGHPQDDAIFASQKYVRRFFSTARNGFKAEPFSEEWLGRIRDLHPLTASIIWVVEVGIKKWCRSTRWITDDYVSYFVSGYAMVYYYG